MKRCTLVADSLVSGAPLSEGDRAHVATCADCAALTALPGMIAATALVPEPGLGFASRITAGARERLARRRRHRVVGLSLATAVAAGTAVAVTQRDPAPAPAVTEVAHRDPAGSDPTPPDADADLDDAELRDLVRRASFDQAMDSPVDWADLEAPLQHYRAVLARGGTP